MPAIRFPSSAVPLLPLCKGHGENAIFRTYADLIGFLAAYGYKLCADLSWRAEPAPELSNKINPIDLDVFQNREILSSFTMIQIAQGASIEGAADEGALCEKIESYASLGAEHLSAAMNRGGCEDPRLVISDLMLEKDQGEVSI
jgi:hypothetical protein